jgi:RNA polymerase sigma-70 factor (ECF subfamily)
VIAERGFDLTERMISRRKPAREVEVALGATSAELCVRSLYGRRAQELFGFARRLGLADEDASDAVQETMLRLWRELEAGTEVVDPDAWAFRVLYRQAIDSHRLRRRLRAMAERLGGGRRADEATGDPAQLADVDAIWRAVDRLPERQRAVLYLRYRADLPYERIGAALAITPSAARGHASTGLATLRRRFQGEVER